MNDVEVSDVLTTGIEYIERANRNRALINDAFYSGDQQKASQLLLEFIEGFNWLEQVTILTDLERSEEQKEILTEFINNLNLSLKNNDWVSVADVVEYEISGVLDIYKQMFKNSLEAREEGKS